MAKVMFTLLFIFLSPCCLIQATQQNSSDEFKKKFHLGSQEIKKNLLECLLFNFDRDATSRKLFKEYFPKDDPKIHAQLCKSCYATNREHLVEVMFALISKYYKNKAVESLKKEGIEYQPPRPGTLGSEEIYSIKLDNAEMYFFMDLEKYELAREMVENANHCMKHGVCAGEYPLVTIEISPVATIAEDPIGYDENLEPLYADQLGTRAIDEYSKKVSDKIKNLLGLNLLALSRQMSLVVSHDAMRFHQDQLPIQYEYLRKKEIGFPKCWLSQDLTLMDWDMSTGTMSGTIMEESSSKERFYFFLKPGEVTTNLTLESPVYPDDGSPPIYLGAKTLPFHTVVAPIDFNSSYNSGSSKGKRISNVVRGVVIDEDVEHLRKKALPLPIDRPEIVHRSESDSLFQYQSGILRKEYPHIHVFPTLADSFFRKTSQEELEILEGHAIRDKALAEIIEVEFNVELKNRDAKIYKIIKRSGGFSSFNKLGIDYDQDSVILAINRSSLPDHYEYYPLACYEKEKNLPWIQLYQLPPNAILKFEGRVLNNFLLTPIEEIFFRNSEWDAASVDVPLLQNSFYTEIDLVIFKKAL